MYAANWPLQRLQRSWALLTDPLKTFWLMIWASDVSLQSWCRKTWISCKWCRKRHAFQGRLRPIIHQTNNYWWRDVDLWVWHALQTSSEWIAFTQWAATEKTMSFLIEKEGDAYGFHGLQRCCASWIPSRKPDRQQDGSDTANRL